MSANKTSSILLTGLFLAAAGLLGVFAIMDASTANASLGEVSPPSTDLQPGIIISPTELQAELPPDGVITQSLWITNTGDTALSFSLLEISGTLKLAPTPGDIKIHHPLPPRAPAQVDADVRSQLLLMNKYRLIIYLHGAADLTAADRIADRTTRVQFVYDQLLELAAQSEDLYSWLRSHGAEPRRLLSANAIAATLDASQLRAVLGFPQVRRVGINSGVEIPPNDPTTVTWLLSTFNKPDTVEWNIARIRADQVWSSLGIRGQGAVVGIVDTGVMYTHPALNAQYRGNQGSGNYDNNYSWYDLVNGLSAPYDDNGHGTFGMGIAVGDDGGNNQIGVAPGAKWIAVKVFDSGGGGTMEQLQAGLDWMLAPTDLNGANPDPSKAPQVVLNMWGLSGCDHTFDASLVALQAANILPVFSPGAEGPQCGSIASPAANPDALTAGATDNSDNISAFSARGPSTCYDGGIKPDVTAPGVNIRSSSIDGSYQVWSGTSLSTAHLAGAAALLFSAKPDLTLAQLKQTLFDTAVCREANNYCGGDACPGPNYTYGYGRIDIYEAVSAVKEPAYDVPWLSENPISATLQPGAGTHITVTFNSAGMLPGEYTGGLSIQSNDPLNPFTTLPVTLTLTTPCQLITDLGASFTPPDPVAGEVITFTAAASGSLPISFSWDFLDGVPLAGPVVTHGFDTPGEHFVGLTAENACDMKTVDLAVPVEDVLHLILLPLVGK